MNIGSLQLDNNAVLAPLAGIWLDLVVPYYISPEYVPVEDTYRLIRETRPEALIAFKQGANGDEDFVAPERGGSAKV